MLDNKRRSVEDRMFNECFVMAAVSCFVVFSVWIKFGDRSMMRA